MSSRHRYPQPRTDRELLADPDTMYVLELVAAGRIDRGWQGGSTAITDPYIATVRLPVGNQLMHRLAFHELIEKPISGPPRLAPRGARLLQVARGELPAPLDD